MIHKSYIFNHQDNELSFVISKYTPVYKYTHTCVWCLWFAYFEYSYQFSIQFYLQATYFFFKSICKNLLTNTDSSAKPHFFL